jgi:hypothetical protein
MDVGVPQAARQIVTPGDTSNGEIPRSLERSEVPLYFRQFRDASVLKKLAHSRKGPLYQLIGRKAWYETADIIAWLEARKGAGPARPRVGSAPNPSAPLQARPPQKKKLGRPTKTEQYLRTLAQQ